MGLNWTTILSAGLAAMILGAFNLIGTRYTNRALDHIEKMLRNNKKKDEDKE